MASKGNLRFKTLLHWIHLAEREDATWHKQHGKCLTFWQCYKSDVKCLNMCGNEMKATKCHAYPQLLDINIIYHNTCTDQTSTCCGWCEILKHDAQTEMLVFHQIRWQGNASKAGK